jgi:hypothetical protein
MEQALSARLFRFLQEEIGISDAEMATVQTLLSKVGLQQPGQSLNLIPIVLWQYGLVTLDQLNCVLDWLEAAQSAI